MVGRIGRPHGVRGEVTVEVRTDDPDLRFVARGGAAHRARRRAGRSPSPRRAGTAAPCCSRWRCPTGVSTDREAAEALRNTQLLVPVDDLPELEDPDSFYDHQLVGLAARLPDGARARRGHRRPARGQPTCSSSAGPRAARCWCRSSRRSCPTVDLGGGFVVVDPPEGLLEL